MTGTVHEDRYTFMVVPRSVPLRVRNIWNKFGEKIKTYILCSITLFRKSVVYEIVWNTNVQPDRREFGACASDFVYLTLQTHTQNM